MPTAPDAAGAEEDEATAAALAHLRALEEAEKFDTHASEDVAPTEGRASTVTSLLGNDVRPRIEYTASAAPQRVYVTPQQRLAQAASGQPVGMPERVAAAPPAPVPFPLPRDLRVIEDIYAAYPIGNGETFMRIERTSPKVFRGVPVAGTLGDIYDRISMDEFTDRFGGHVYDIHVIGPATGKQNVNGEVPIRTLTTVELKVPGPPVMDSIANPTEEAMHQGRPGLGVPRNMQPMYSNGAGYQPTPQLPESVLLAQLQAEERARERQEAERNEFLKAGRPPAEVIQAATQAARDAVTIARTSADEKVQILREQNQGLLDSLSRRDEELRILRDKLTASERAAAEARQFTETEQIKRINEAHSAAVQRMQDDYSRELNRVLQDSRDKLSDETRRHVEERAKAEADGMRERQRLQEDYDRRDRAVKEQNDLIRIQMKEQYDARILDLERRTADQIAAVKEQRDREIESLRTSVKAEATVVKETSGFRVDHLQVRLTEVQTEVERLRRENDDLRKKGQKDPVLYLQECASVARDLLGMVKPEEVEKEAPSGGETDTSWKGIAAKGLMGLVDGLPRIVEQVGAVRAQNQAMQQQAQAQQQAARQAAAARDAAVQQQAAAQRQMAMLPPSQAMMAGPTMDPRRRSLMSSTPGWGSSTPPPPGAAVGMPVPVVAPLMGPPPAPLARQVNGLVTGLPGPSAGPPVTGEMLYASGASPVQPDVIAAPAPQTAPQAPAPAPRQQEQAESGPGLTQEAVMEFVSQLNEHIGDGTPVELFALGFVNKVGKETAADLLSKITPNDLISVISESDGGDDSYILTAKGRDYVNRLWVEAGKLVA